LNKIRRNFRIPDLANTVGLYSKNQKEFQSAVVSLTAV
jgi:hypothetical protein